MQHSFVETSEAGRAFGSEACPSGRSEGIERRETADLERLYRAYSQRVYSLCMRMTGDVAEAEDLTQEAFVHLYRKLDTFRGQSAFFTWFYRMVVNLILMRLRRKKRSRETLFTDVENSSPEGASSLPLEIHSNDPALLFTADRVDVQRAIELLPPGFRMVLVLHDIEGYEHQEISALTGMSVGTSKSQLHKARLRLRRLLREGALARTARCGGRPRIRATISSPVRIEPFPAF